MGLLWKLLRYGQRMLVYPSGFLDGPDIVYTPDTLNMPYEDVTITTRDGVNLHCFLIQAEGADQNPRGTVIMCHGNAMNHGDILDEALALFTLGFSVFTLEYRGYGNNEGRPSEKGLRRDAQAAFDYVLSHPTLSKRPIILFGQSLGGAVAIDVTKRNASNVSALIVENTFTSIPNLVKGFPVLRHVSFLCTQRWNSHSKVSRLPPSLPILMLSGVMDSVVPPEHMQSLWEVAQKRHSKDVCKETTTNLPEKIYDGLVLVKFPRGAHNTTCIQPGYREAVQSFLNQHIPADQERDIATKD